MYDHWIEDESSKILGNATTLTCSPDGQDGFVCIRYNYWFAILTLLFIYLPSVNVIATLYGPQKDGFVGFCEGLAMAILGGILAATGYFLPSPGAAIAGWFMICIGAGVFVMGWVNWFSVPGGSDEDKYHFLLFIPLLICSPVIFIIIKLLAIIKSDNKFIQSQSTYGSRGEAILEAAPQFGLQVYIVLLSMSGTKNQWFSIITSAASISIPSIENYVSERGGDFGPKAIIKNIWVFLPACLFKVLSVSLLAVFLRGWVILVIVVIIVLVFVALVITKSCYDLPLEEDDNQQVMECLLLSWLTLGGLGRSEWAAVFRLVSTLLITIIYSLILGIILAICIIDPASGNIHGAGVSWADLELVKDTHHMNLLVGCTIGLGWISLLVDVLLDWAKSHDWRSHNWGPLKKVVHWFVDPQDEQAGFWDKAVLLVGLGVRQKTDPEDLEAGLEVGLKEDIEVDLEGPEIAQCFLNDSSKMMK